MSNIGILRLELSKEVYERAGLQGVPVPSDGRKHIKARYRKSAACPSSEYGPVGCVLTFWQLWRSISAFPPRCTGRKGLIGCCGRHNMSSIEALTGSSWIWMQVSTGLHRLKLMQNADTFCRYRIPDRTTSGRASSNSADVDVFEATAVGQSDSRHSEYSSCRPKRFFFWED